MALKPWEELTPEPLTFPIGGKQYVVKPLGFKAGLRLEEILSSDNFAGAKYEDLWRLGLGDAFDEMVADDVSPRAIARAGMAAITDYRSGRDNAELVWEAGLDPEALAAAATAVRQQENQPTDPTPSPSTGEASETPSPASTSGTRASRRKQPAQG